MKNRKKVEREIYYNAKEDVAIGYDKWQWIIAHKNTHQFYPTFTMMLQRLGEEKVREYTGKDIKNLYDAIVRVYNLCEEIGNTMNNLPDDVRSDDLVTDEEYDYACKLFHTDDPTNKQLDIACQDLAEQAEAHMNDDIN